MKTFLFAAAMALTTLTASANKSDNKSASYKLNNSLHAEFGAVDNVNWSEGPNNMYKASFTSNEEKVTAFFQADGELVASTVEVAVNYLPTKIKNAIYAQEKDGVITEAVHFTNATEMAYYVKVYVNGAEKIYKSTSGGQITQTKF